MSAGYAREVLRYREAMLLEWRYFLPKTPVDSLKRDASWRRDFIAERRGTPEDRLYWRKQLRFIRREIRRRHGGV